MKYLSLMVAGGLASLIGPAQAQTLYVFDGAAAVVRELSGPPDSSFCAYPDGPVISAFSTQTDFICPLPGAIVSPLHGDLAVNRAADTVWVTDGRRIAEYDPKGLVLNSFALPAGMLQSDIQGMGFNGGSLTMWLTDGSSAVEVKPPPIPCGSPTLVNGPFTIPPLGAAFGSVTDIAVAPATGTLWVCDDLGNIGNITTTGALLQSIAIAPGICGLSPRLLGMSTDTSTSTPGVLYVTDGLRIANVDSSGAAAPPTFAFPSTCFSVTTGFANGMAFSARPVTYGVGGGASTSPDMGSIGQAVIPSTNLAITLRNATPGDIAMLPFTQKPLCPAIFVVLAPILILPPAFAVVMATVDPQGEILRQIPIPPSTTVGLEVMYQWFVLGGGPSPDGPPLVSSGAGSLRAGFR